MTWKTHFDWALLSFAAGSVNAGGFLACNRFVTHVTGFATVAGAAAVGGDWVGVTQALTVPIYFLLGVMLSAAFVENLPKAHRSFRYAGVLALVCGLLTTAAVAGLSGWFGVFGAKNGSWAEYVLLSVLSLAAGLENAAVSISSGATVRITHLTGATTDLGIGLVRTWRARREAHKDEVQANWIRARTILAFMLGSAVGCFGYLHFGYSGFFLPAGLMLYATLVAYRSARL